MHELSLSQSIMEIIEQQARQREFSRVKRVGLEIGALSCVEPEALSFCFDSVTRGSLAQGARLDIARVPGRAWCWDCEKVAEITRHGDACPGCGGYRMNTQGGNEMRIKELEVE